MSEFTVAQIEALARRDWIPRDIRQALTAYSFVLRERAITDELHARLTGILTATANALKGEPEALHAHSWHDLAEVAAEVAAERDALLARIENAPVGDLSASLGEVKLRDVDVSVLALDGKRVRLVAESPDHG